jgi:hypothetical protein
MNEPRFSWTGRGDLLCGRVKVGSARPAPFGPTTADGEPAPWFCQVGDGYPAPFEAWFHTEAEARAAVEAAARHLLFGETADA